MQEAKHPTTTKLPSQSQSSSPSPSLSAPTAANPLRYQHGYGTFPQPSTPPVVGAAAAYHASPIGGCSLSRRHYYPRFSPPLLVLRYDSIDASVCLRWLRSGFGGQGFVAFPCAVQQQVFVEAEGVPVREPPLPFCGVGIGWFL